MHPPDNVGIIMTITTLAIVVAVMIVKILFVCMKNAFNENTYTLSKNKELCYLFYGFSGFVYKPLLV